MEHVKFETMMEVIEATYPTGDVADKVRKYSEWNDMGIGSIVWSFSDLFIFAHTDEGQDFWWDVCKLIDSILGLDGEL